MTGGTGHVDGEFSGRLERARRVLIDEVGALIGGRPVALVNFPDHSNCGDSAVWLGEERLLASIGARVRYRASIANYRGRVLDALGTDTVVLVSGGGNFGDLWLSHHRFRLGLIEALPRHRIVQLPQSVFFAERQWRDETRRVVGSHPDFHLFVRERQSLELATDLLECPVHLAPDSALMLGPLPPGSRDRPVVVLARTDQETTDGLRRHAAQAGVTTVDWWRGDEHNPPSSQPRMRRSRLAQLARAGDDAIRLLRRLRPASTGVSRLEGAALGRRAQYHLSRAVAMLGRGAMVVTDRLHGQLLCELMGVPNVAVDTGYGKIRGVHEAWLADSPTSKLAVSVEEAMAIVLELGGAGQA